MEDRHMKYQENIDRLVNDYKTHNNLFVAFDFDNTVFDYHGVGDTYAKIERLLTRCKKAGLTLILFTGNEGDKLQECVDYCKDRGYKPDLVNTNPIMNTTKPYYNILLDDRAGLACSYHTLHETLNKLKL